MNKEGIEFSPKIFKIRLFDSIGEQRDKSQVSYWFNNGLFHCLKHFSIGNINIAGKQIEEKPKRTLNSFCELIRFYVINALYFTELSESNKKDTFDANIKWDSGEKSKVSLYHEKNNGIYSLDTIIPN